MSRIKTVNLKNKLDTKEESNGELGNKKDIRQVENK